MSLIQGFIDFFEEYGIIVRKYPFPFLTFALLCIGATWAFSRWMYQIKLSKLQEEDSRIKEENSQIKEDCESLRQKLSSSEKKIFSLEADVNRLKKQFKNLKLEAWIAASREEPEGIAAGKISSSVQSSRKG